MVLIINMNCDPPCWQNQSGNECKSLREEIKTRNS